MRKLLIALMATALIVPTLALADDFKGLSPAATPQVYGFLDNKFYDVSGALKYFGFMDGSLFDINGKAVSRESVGLPPLAATTPTNTQPSATNSNNQPTSNSVSISPAMPSGPQGSGTFSVPDYKGNTTYFGISVYNLSPNTTYSYRISTLRCPSDKTQNQVSDVHIDNLAATSADVFWTGNAYGLQFGANGNLKTIGNTSGACSVYDNPAQVQTIYTDTLTFTTPAQTTPTILANLQATNSGDGAFNRPNFSIIWTDFYPSPMEYSVEYGTSPELLNSQTLTLYSCHQLYSSISAPLPKLAPGTYYYRVTGKVCPNANTLPDNSVLQIQSQIQSFKIQ